MILPSDIVARMRDAVAADAAVEAYCQAQFGASLIVKKGEDARDPYGEADAPFLVLYPGEYAGGEDAASFRHALVGYVLITDETTDSEGLLGHETLDGLVKLVYTALRDASDNVTVTGFGLATDVDLLPPAFGYWLDISCQVPNLIGGEVAL